MRFQVQKQKITVHSFSRLEIKKKCFSDEKKIESLKLEAAEIEQPTTPAINFDKRVAGPDQTFGVTIFFNF